MNFTDKLKLAAPIVLRLTLSAVFVWFGFSQILNPSAWTSLVPTWAVSLYHLSPLGVVYLNGVFEIIAGSLLALGFWVRWVALVLSIHLFVIAADFGINPIGVRDIGLSLSTFAIFLFGDDSWSHKNETLGEDQENR